MPTAKRDFAKLVRRSRCPTSSWSRRRHAFVLWVRYDALMRLVLAFLLVGHAIAADAQTAKPRAATPIATTTLGITITDGKGTPLSGVSVRASGPIDREGATDNAGWLRFEGLRSGNYRLRFTHNGFVTLERDLVVPAGQRSMDQQVMLSQAERPATPEKTATPPRPEPNPTPALPPPGKAVTVSLPSYIEQNFISGSQPQKVSPVACSGLSESVLWQIREPWQNRQHPNADAMLYVVGGEGTLRMNERDLPLDAGTFISVPRGTSYGLTRRGRNPLIVLATIAGQPCSQ
jgi:mannose-6-phosphate isomerase-like protein (cupin superfamily)